MKARTLLAGLAAASMEERERSTDISMEELAALVETAGGETVAMLIQLRDGNTGVIPNLTEEPEE